MEIKIREFGLDEKVSFRKYNGHTVREIYQYDPSYLDYICADENSFYVDLQRLISILPTPTPMKLSFSNLTKSWLSNIFPNKNYILEAHEYIRQGYVIPEKPYTFSDKALNKLKEKHLKLIEQKEDRRRRRESEEDFYRSDDYD